MFESCGRVIKGVGGLFSVRLNPGNAPLDGQTVLARGRGNLRRKGELLVGDFVTVTYGENVSADNTDGSGIAIERIMERSSVLIRPPMANLDVLFAVVAAAEPDPVTVTVDKLLAIAEFHSIETKVIITKRDLDPVNAERLAEVYRLAGMDVFVCEKDGDLSDLKKVISEELGGKIAAFSGASGVGKSTLLNRLFPQLHLKTGELSHRIERGKNTTRSVELYPLDDTQNCGFLADTPGFTMLDFERFDFFELDDLPLTFREFAPWIGNCRYKKCTHTKEDGCAVLQAVRDGKIAKSRHDSFLDLYDTLKKKTKW